MTDLALGVKCGLPSVGENFGWAGEAEAEVGEEHPAGQLVAWEGWSAKGVHLQRSF